MDKSVGEELTQQHDKIRTWIEGKVAYKDDDLKESIVTFFKYLYKESSKLIDNKNPEQNKKDKDRISVMILDLLFYSLLSDFCSRINNIVRGMYNDYETNEIMIKLFRDIGDNVQKVFILNGIRLFDIGTSIYYNVEAPNRLHKESKDFPTPFPPNLILLLDDVCCYLKLYSLSRSRLIERSDISKFKDLRFSDNPYLLAGFINLLIKYIKDHPLNTVGDNYVKGDLDNLFKKLFELMKQPEFTRFNEGYYFLLRARYKTIKKEFQSALGDCDFAMISTNNECIRNGERRKDILSLKNKILGKIELKEELQDMEKTKKRLSEYKQETYKLIGIILPVIVIPISVLIAFLDVEKKSQSIGLVMLLLGGIVVSILLTSFFIILIPYIFRILDNTLDIKIVRYLNVRKNNKNNNKRGA